MTGLTGALGPTREPRCPISRVQRASPIDREIVLQKLSAPVPAGQYPVKERIADPGRAVDNVQGRLEIMHLLLEFGQFRGIFIRDPSGVDRIHIDAVPGQVFGRGVRHHVQGRFCHVRMGMARVFPEPEKLAFHSRHIDDMLLTGTLSPHQSGQSVA